MITCNHPRLAAQALRHLRNVGLWFGAASMSLALAQPAAPAVSAATPAVAKLDCGRNTGQRATGEPIYLGGMVSKTGPDDFSASGISANAFFRCVNDNGGIHGRPIIYTQADDKWDPKLAAELAKQLITERNVVAMVGGSSFVECSANQDLYRQHGITALVGTGVPRQCFFSPHVAAVNTGPRISATIAAQHAAHLSSAKSVVCVVHNIPDVSPWACEGVRDWAVKAGLKAQVVAFDIAKFNPGEVLNQAMTHKPDLMVINLPRGLLIPLLQEANNRKLQRTVMFASSAPAYNPEVDRALGPDWKDRLVVNLEFAPVDSTGPDNMNWRAVMNKYALRTDTRDAFSQSGYLAARVLTQAMLTLKPDQINRQNVNAAIRRIRDLRSDMLCRPFYVAPAGQRNNANHTGPVAVFNGTGWNVLAGQCILAADPELADVLAAERRMGVSR
jgi:branched-chain amino acid transport system substrate-binding protein